MAIATTIKVIVVHIKEAELRARFRKMLLKAFTTFLKNILINLICYITSFLCIIYYYTI